MSAHIVENDTIDLIATFAKSVADTGDEFFATISDPQTCGLVLLHANAESVAYRYDEEPEDVSSYRFKPVRLRRATFGLDPIVVVLKSISCLRYQSCERPDYAQSDAAKLLNSIERDAIRSLTGYKVAPWGWTREFLREGVSR